MQEEIKDFVYGMGFREGWRQAKLGEIRHGRYYAESESYRNGFHEGIESFQNGEPEPVNPLRGED